MKLGRSVLVMALCVGLCGVVLANSASFAAPASKPKPDPNATFRYMQPVNGVLTQWFPQKSTNIFGEYQQHVLVYDTLLRLGQDGTTLRPRLATSWEWDAAGTTLTMNLRTDVKFHDGSSFDASVAVANLNIAREAGSTGQLGLAGISDVTAINSTTLRVNLKAPDPAVLYNFWTQSGMMVSKAGLADPIKLRSTPAGSGPYKLVSYDLNGWKADRNPDYWDKSIVYPAHFEGAFVADTNSRLNAVVTGAADITYLGDPTVVESAKKLVQGGQLRLAEYTAVNPFAFLINTSLPPFNDPEVRRAINLAVDRAGIAKLIGCEATSQPWGQTVAGYVKGLAYKYDVKTASKIIRKQGASGASFDLQVPIGNEPQVTLGTIIQSQLAAIGLKANLVPTTGNLVRTNFAQGRTASTVLGMISTNPDASGLLDTYYLGAGNPGLKDPALVTKIATARTLPLGSKQRATAYQEIERALFSTNSLVTICLPVSPWVARTNVIGAATMPSARIGQFADESVLQIAKGK